MTPFDPDDLAAAQTAAGLTEDQLLLDLGRALAGPGADRDRGTGDLQGDARNWFDRNRDSLRALLCGRPDLHALTDNATDIATIADVLAGTYNKPTVFTIAAILLKRGIHRLCQD